MFHQKKMYPNSTISFFLNKNATSIFVGKIHYRDAVFL